MSQSLGLWGGMYDEKIWIFEAGCKSGKARQQGAPIDVAEIDEDEVAVASLVKADCIQQNEGH